MESKWRLHNCMFPKINVLIKSKARMENSNLLYEKRRLLGIWQIQSLAYIH